MRALFGCGLLLVLFASSGLGVDEEKIDAKKLVGKWEPKEPKKDFAMRIEFAADGKLNITTRTNDGSTSTEGSWKLDGNKLTTILKSGENESKDTVTITKLTDMELVAETAKKDQKQVLKRVK